MAPKGKRDSAPQGRKHAGGKPPSRKGGGKDRAPPAGDRRDAAPVPPKTRPQKDRAHGTDTHKGPPRKDGGRKDGGYRKGGDKNEGYKSEGHKKGAKDGHKARRPDAAAPPARDRKPGGKPFRDNQSRPRPPRDTAVRDEAPEARKTGARKPDSRKFGDENPGNRKPGHRPPRGGPPRGAADAPARFAGKRPAARRDGTDPASGNRKPPDRESREWTSRERGSSERTSHEQTSRGRASGKRARQGHTGQDRAGQDHAGPKRTRTEHARTEHARAAPSGKRPPAAKRPAGQKAYRRPGNPAGNPAAGPRASSGSAKNAAPKAPPRNPATGPGDGDGKSNGERIAKVLARAGLCSRRDAEGWIAEGRVSVNGQILTTPAVTVRDTDQVAVDGKPLPQAEAARLFLYHKPAGLVTTARDEKGRPTVFDNLPPGLPRLVSVGRLDLNTEGLLLLTNDGGLARHLELPATGWKRRYRVRAHGRMPAPETIAKLADGVTIDGIKYGGIEIVADRQQGANCWLTVALREGRNREVRKVLEHIGLTVNRLIRLSYGPFQLGTLPEGAAKEVERKVLRDQLPQFFN